MISQKRDLAARIVAITVSELNEIIPSSKIEGLRIRISDNNRTIGLATYNKNEIMISTWSLKKSIHFIRWLICHEIAHLVTFQSGHKNEHHGKIFKKVERKLCAAFKIQLAYSNGRPRAYPSGLFGPDGHFERMN